MQYLVLCDSEKTRRGSKQYCKCNLKKEKDIWGLGGGGGLQAAISSKIEKVPSKNVSVPKL